ncbi:ATP-binding protein [Sulfurospirillum sp. T05]|uniref:histidine kinase n=1 Tax=Sulfurospirillum tamanense TaxID=2813362 RepID=A0ABS2WTA7_9BACT|nr:ATP-binding protein [Sulfurospirillum tamanensis]MBN2964892.1 ATP-binding protein [Sulfurospirillum tamanensis]
MSKWYMSVLSSFQAMSVPRKTTLLFMILVSGMLLVGSFAHLGLSRMKYEFDILYSKYTLPMIQLENLKDVYTVNILDTLREIEANEVGVRDGKRVIELAQELVHRSWREYKGSLEADEGDWMVRVFRNLGLTSDEGREAIPLALKQDLVFRTEERIARVNGILEAMFEHFEKYETQKAFMLLRESLYPAIHSVNIHLTQLIDFSLEAANGGKRRTEQVYTTTFEWIIAGVVLAIIVAALFAAVILQHIRALYANLEKTVEEKTKELVKLNEGLEKRIAEEIEQSRQKDEIMYRQSRLAAMGEMIGNIAHQWRQPLNALALLVQSFQTKQMHGKLDEAFVDAQVAQGVMLANSMSKTIDDFRNYFHTGREKGVFNLCENINHTVAMMRDFYAKDAIEISLTCKGACQAFGYANEFSQVIMNLFSNAKDALEKREGKRWIVVEITQEEAYSCVGIIDNGGGIPLEVLERMFDPYFTTKHQASGTGIGLYMSKQIIENQMQGTIRASNTTYFFKGKEYPSCAKIEIKIPTGEIPIKGQ